MSGCVAEVGRRSTGLPVKLRQNGLVRVSDEQNATVNGKNASSNLVMDTEVRNNYISQGSDQVRKRGGGGWGGSKIR